MPAAGNLAGFVLAISICLSSQPAWADSHAADGRLLSEIRLGLLYHDAGIWVVPSADLRSVEPAGPDVNAELLFNALGFLAFLGSPRPHIGATVNPQGATSQAYLGLTWDWDLTDRLLFELAAGGAVHNGETDPLRADADEKPMGCRALLRFSAGLGIRVAARHSVMLAFDHISNGFLCDPNPGLDTVGMRWGYRF